MVIDDFNVEFLWSVDLNNFARPNLYIEFFFVDDMLQFFKDVNADFQFNSVVANISVNIRVQLRSQRLETTTWIFNHGEDLFVSWEIFPIVKVHTLATITVPCDLVVPLIGVIVEFEGSFWVVHSSHDLVYKNFIFILQPVRLPEFDEKA